MKSALSHNRGQPMKDNSILIAVAKSVVFVEDGKTKKRIECSVVKTEDKIKIPDTYLNYFFELNLNP